MPKAGSVQQTLVAKAGSAATESMAIPQSFIQELIARSDVVEVVGRYVQLKKGGANYMGLCPFHGEKSPRSRSVPASNFSIALVAEKMAMRLVF